jgi:hypothetical protein
MPIEGFVHRAAGQVIGFSIARQDGQNQAGHCSE